MNPYGLTRKSVLRYPCYRCKVVYGSFQCTVQLLSKSLLQKITVLEVIFMYKKQFGLLTISIGTLFVLGSCSNQIPSGDSNGTSPSSTATSNEMNEINGMSSMSSEMEEMNHEGEVPSGMVEASDPEFPVGTKVTVLTDHMPGMQDAQAEIVGAYDTTIYEVSYEPATGGEKVMNHKWVVQEELEDTKTIAKAGDTVTLTADHMAGMNGAKATVEFALTDTAYVIDYVPSDGGEPVKNHMWVTSDELSLDETP